MFFDPSLMGVECRILVSPNASQNSIGKIENKQLKVRVTAIPEKGKANDAVIKLLSKEWDIPKSSMEITRGTKFKYKTLVINGDAHSLMQKLETWLAKRA